MAIGLLGKAALPAGTHTIIATINGASGAQTANITMVNHDPVNSVTVRLAICPTGYSSGAPADADYIEAKDTVIPPLGKLENTGYACTNGEKIVAQASANSVTVRAHGF